MKMDKIKEKASKAYSAQKTRCYNQNSTQYKWYGAKGIEIEYTLKEFTDWYIKQINEFKEEKPTIGRIDHSKNYTLQNIEMISQKKNSEERIKRCGYLVPAIPVIGINQKTGEKRVFESENEAERFTGHSMSTVKRQCTGYSKNPITIWKFSYLEK